MKIIIFLLINITLYAEIVMDNGVCFERKGNMNYIVPCPSQRSIESKDIQETIAESKDDISKQKGDPCSLAMGKYSIVYKSYASDNAVEISCLDAKEYINSMYLGYEVSLSAGKKKIGNLSIKRGFSTCSIELFYGEYIAVGIMSGDENMCNDFMTYHSQVRAKKRIK